MYYELETWDGVQRLCCFDEHGRMLSETKLPTAFTWFYVDKELFAIAR